MTAPPRLIRKEFRDWLAGKKPRQVVGKRRSFSSCPLACFLKDRTGERHVMVAEGEICIGLRSKTPPLWAGAFIVGVDASGPVDKRITAATALRILDGVS